MLSSGDQTALTSMAFTCSSRQRQSTLTGQLRASTSVACRWVNVFAVIVCQNHSNLYMATFQKDTRINKDLAICCVLQDPPGIPLYVSVKVVVMNGVRLNKHKCRRGSNSLEGLHAHLFNAVPSQQCGIMPFQVSD